MNIVLVALLLVVIGCGDSPPAQPAPPPTTPTSEPSIPEIASMSEPARGQAKLTLPRWDRARNRYGHEVSDARATMGTTEGATRIELVRGETTMGLTYYGDALAPGEYDVTADDEGAIARVRGTDARVFVARMTKGAQIAKSVSGHVTITASDGEVVAGSFDINASGTLVSGSIVLRGRFQAARDRQLDAFLEQQRAISERLEKQR